jgi:hypothetical protein
VLLNCSAGDFRDLSSARPQPYKWKAPLPLGQLASKLEQPTTPMTELRMATSIDSQMANCRGWEGSTVDV